MKLIIRKLEHSFLKGYVDTDSVRVDNKCGL